MAPITRYFLDLCYLGLMLLNLRQRRNYKKQNSAEILVLGPTLVPGFDWIVK